MDFPALMPTQLLYVEAATSDQELLSLLRDIPSDFVNFFEVASADETWSGRHDLFMRETLELFTERACQGKLLQEDIRRIAAAIQRHHLILRPFIPNTTKVKLKDATVSCNGLLLAAASSPLKTELLINYRNKKGGVLSFSSVTGQTFDFIKQFAYSGIVSELLIMGEEDLIILLRQALNWEIKDLVHLCARMLAKYLTTDNLVPRFIQSRRENWLHFQQLCTDFIEKNELGFRLHLLPNERLGLEFCIFNEQSLKFYHSLLPLLTDLICHDALASDPQFGDALKQATHLVALDLSRTLEMSPYLAEAPGALQEINLSECLWVSQESLKQLHQVCPHLVKISLCGDFQLNFLAWGELRRFKELKVLDLTMCSQIQDDDLIVITRACSGLTELTLTGCTQISHAGYRRRRI
ncbi:MAG: hypothetical protein WCF65_02945 [Parachlamydiaceae bacterium]